jgi:imidazolonepropionase-like amidohydrolase
MRGFGQEAIIGYLPPPYPGRPPHVADGVDEMRRVVRLHLHAQVDWIKLFTSGGIPSDAISAPDDTELTEAEVEVAVMEASRRGVPVAAHAMSVDGIRMAVAAGVRSIEHGDYLTEELASMMAQKGAWLVPTMTVYHLMQERAAAGRLDPLTLARAQKLAPTYGQAVRIAHEYGVRIAMGSDLSAHNFSLREMGYMHRDGGLSVEETLLAATAGGAELCGVADTRGRIAPGFVFDAILIDQDPGDLTVFDDPAGVTGVFQAGRVIKLHDRATALSATNGDQRI